MTEEEAFESAQRLSSYVTNDIWIDPQVAIRLASSSNSDSFRATLPVRSERYARSSCRAAVVLQQSLLAFCFIGGIGVQGWGEPRFTHDADLALWTGFDQHLN